APGANPGNPEGSARFAGKPRDENRGNTKNPENRQTSPYLLYFSRKSNNHPTLLAMAHSTVRNTLHCIFAVKNRLPLLHPDVRPLLFERIRSIVELRYPRCELITINGVVDHVHALLDLH